jgi:hypothetical protein
MTARHAFRQRLLKRPDDGVDHDWEAPVVVSHWGGRISTEEGPWRQDQFQRSKHALVRGLVRRNEILECDPRGGPAAAVVTRIDATGYLGR